MPTLNPLKKSVNLDKENLFCNFCCISSYDAVIIIFCYINHGVLVFSLCKYSIKVRHWSDWTFWLNDIIRQSKLSKIHTLCHDTWITTLRISYNAEVLKLQYIADGLKNKLSG